MTARDCQANGQTLTRAVVAVRHHCLTAVEVAVAAVQHSHPTAAAAAAMAAAAAASGRARTRMGEGGGFRGRRSRPHILAVGSGKESSGTSQSGTQCCTCRGPAAPARSSKYSGLQTLP